MTAIGTKKTIGPKKTENLLHAKNRCLVNLETNTFQLYS
jgi:hypothetical protein